MDPQVAPVSGRYVVVRLEDSKEATFKQLIIEEGPSVSEGAKFGLAAPSHRGELECGDLRGGRVQGGCGLMSSSAWSPGANPGSLRVNCASGVDEKAINGGQEVILKSPPVT